MPSRQEGNTEADLSKPNNKCRQKQLRKASSTSSASKKRKNQSADTGQKTGKAPRTRKTKTGNTESARGCQDISQGLPRTKPTASGNIVPSIETKSPPADVLFEPSFHAEQFHGALAPQETTEPVYRPQSKGQPSSLGSNYQVAYPNTRESAVKVATPPRSDLAPAVFPHPVVKDEHPSYQEDFLAEQQVWPAQDDGLLLQHKPITSDDLNAEDCEVPPSGQGVNPIDQPQNSQQVQTEETENFPDLTLEDFFDVDEFQVLNDLDEYPMEDESLGEILQSMSSPSWHDDPVSEWRPQELSDDPLVGEDPCGARFKAPPCYGSATTYKKISLATSRRAQHTLSPSQPLSLQSPGPLAHISGNVVNAERNHAKTPEESENCFDDDDLDEWLIDLAANDSENIETRLPLTPPRRASTPKLQWMPPKTYTPAKSSHAPAPPIDVPHLVPFNINGEALPFLRPQFPKPIRDRSPILGLSNRTVLRTCFRIGEALNAAAVASRSNTDAIIELYARIVLSEREDGGGFKQFFQLGDLFTDKPPYLSATYNLWKGVGLWNNDSKAFLGEAGKGKMARIVGRIKKCEQKGACEMVVLSIWEADWEDVGVAKGIVCS